MHGISISRTENAANDLQRLQSSKFYSFALCGAIYIFRSDAAFHCLFICATFSGTLCSVPVHNPAYTSYAPRTTLSLWLACGVCVCVFTCWNKLAQTHTHRTTPYTPFVCSWQSATGFSLVPGANKILCTHTHSPKPFENIPHTHTHTNTWTHADTHTIHRIHERPTVTGNAAGKIGWQSGAVLVFWASDGVRVYRYFYLVI